MQTKIRSHQGPRAARAAGSYALDAREMLSVAAVSAELARLGVNISDRDVKRQIDAWNDFGGAWGMDEVIPPGLGVLPSTIPTPIQFLQAWLPGFVRIVTQPRTIDGLVGITTAGDWMDEEVIQGIIEPVGKPQPYGDLNNIPLASWNPSFERRTIVAMELGFRVGVREEGRAAKMNINTASEKRSAVQLALDIVRNRIGFYGYNNGAGRTYGFLNDPNLPAYVTVAAGTGGTTWATKTFQEITADLRTAAAALRVKSRGVIDPMGQAITLAVPNAVVDFLTVTNGVGTQSVREWITQSYPNWRIQAAPELDGANGGANVFYLYAETVVDGGSDGGATFAQIVPARYQMLGVEKGAKHYTEDSITATAGVFVKRPFAIVRYTGI